LVLEKIPTKALYKLQVSVAHEVELCTRTYAMKLKHTKNGKDASELVIKQVKIKTKEEKK